MIAFKLKIQNKDEKTYLSKKDVENIIDKEDVIIEFKEKAEKLGYKICYPYFLINNMIKNTKDCQLLITPKKDNDYLPNLFMVSSNKCEIKFQIYSHGFLSEDEMSNFLDAQKAGIEMAKLIKEYYDLLPSVIIADY